MSKGLEAFERLKEGDSPSAPRDIEIVEKELKDYEWLKSKISIDFFYQLSSDDRLKLMEIMGFKYER